MKPDALTTQELRQIANREKKAQDKREQRARQATERATAALAPNPDGYEIPKMPAGLSAIRKWVREAHDAYSERRIGPLELTEVRRSASSVGDLYRTGAELRKAEAAIRAAQAQERLVETLAALEHGGAALAMLVKLQDGLTDGRRRPLPGRALSAVPPSSPAEPA
jgi:hypothetical protein